MERLEDRHFPKANWNAIIKSERLGTENTLYCGTSLWAAMEQLVS
jgi:hypothetical protein